MENTKVKTKLWYFFVYGIFYKKEKGDFHEKEKKMGGSAFGDAVGGFLL